LNVKNKHQKIMVEPYIKQKVVEAIETLVGGPSAEHAKRLIAAALKARQGILPIHRPTLSEEALTHLKVLETDKYYDLQGLESEENFYKFREALVHYMLSSQDDAGQTRS
jgi:hypothetical protein